MYSAPCVKCRVPCCPRRAGELSFNEAECYASLAHFLFRFRRNFLVNSEGILVGGDCVYICNHICTLRSAPLSSCYFCRVALQIEAPFIAASESLVFLKRSPRRGGKRAFSCPTNPVCDALCRPLRPSARRGSCALLGSMSGQSIRRFTRLWWRAAGATLSLVRTHFHQTREAWLFETA